MIHIKSIFFFAIIIICGCAPPVDVIRQQNMDMRTDVNTNSGDPQKSGYVTQKILNGVYVGELQNGVFHGKGTFTWNSGHKYTGEYRNGKMAGTGRLDWPEGFYYVGEFRDGKRHGSGKLVYRNATFAGTFSDGKIVGQGSAGYSDGRKIVGYFSQSKEGHLYPPSNGTLTFKDGTKYQGKLSGGYPDLEGGTFFTSRGEVRNGNGRCATLQGEESCIFANGKRVDSAYRQRIEIAKIDAQEEQFQKEQERIRKENERIANERQREIDRLRENAERARQEAEDSDDDEGPHWADQMEAIINKVGNDAQAILAENDRRREETIRERKRVSREIERKYERERQEWWEQKQKLDREQARREQEAEQNRKELAEQRLQVKQKYAYASTNNSSNSGNHNVPQTAKPNRYNDPNRTYTGCFDTHGNTDWSLPVGEYRKDFFGSIVIGVIPITMQKTNGEKLTHNLIIREYGPQPEWNNKCKYDSIQEIIDQWATGHGYAVPSDWNRYITRSTLKYPVPERYWGKFINP